MGKRKRQKVYDITTGHCWYCGIPITIDDMCIDHINPQSLSGTHDIDNLLPACRSCNSRKRDKNLDEYREWLAWRRISVEPFTKAQMLYFQSLGIELPAPPAVVFWGEKPR